MSAEIDMDAAPVVALDIGNVCLSIDPCRCARELGFASLAALTRRWPGVARTVHQLETGVIDGPEFVGAVDALTEGRLGEDRIRRAWISILGEEIGGVAGLVRDMVEAGLRVVWFSDTSELHYRALLPRISFGPLIHGAVLSYEVGATKPDPVMFTALEEAYCQGGVPALFIDDKLSNIDAARVRGWPAYRFGTVAGVKAALRSV